MLGTYDIVSFVILKQNEQLPHYIACIILMEI